MPHQVQRAEPPSPRGPGTVVFSAPDLLLLRGEVDLDAVRRSPATEDQLEAVRTVDVSGAVLRSSAALVLLLLCVRHVAAQDPPARLRLVGVSPRLRERLEVMGLADVLDLVDVEEVPAAAGA